MKILSPLVCLVVISLTALPVIAAEVAEADKTFVVKAAQGGMTEVQLGHLASEKGTSSDVKSFGAQMVADHGKANDELKSIATAKGIVISDKLDAKHQAMVEKMTALSGAAFDKAYVDEMEIGRAHV